MRSNSFGKKDWANDGTDLLTQVKSLLARQDLLPGASRERRDDDDPSLWHTGRFARSRNLSRCIPGSLKHAGSFRNLGH
jgi:hypothetical protein